MRIDIMTLFPDAPAHVLGESIIGRAAKKGAVEINCVQIRDYTDNKQMQVDDYPYGGGWGCVMMAQPLKACLDDIMSTARGLRSRVIYMSPQGARFDQEQAKRLVRDYDHLVLVCGHYEGIDERFIEECVDEELSLGDFVLTGGEIAAMAVADCVCRMVPGVLADEECYTGESHWDGLLEYPQYTRPESWQGRSVPPVLLTGNHADVARWRRKKQLERTMDKRPDMFAELSLEDKTDRELMAEIVAERSPEKPKPAFDCRRAEATDLVDIMSMADDARAYLRSQGVDQWQNSYPYESTILADTDRGEGWLFTCEGRVAGYMCLSMSHEDDYDALRGKWLTSGDGYSVVHRSMISGDFRGSGLSREMLSLAEDLSAGMGKTSVRADTHPDNIPMNTLMRKSGYTLCGEITLSSGVDGHDPRRNAYEKVIV